MLWDQIKKIKNPNQEVRFLLLKSLKPFFLGKNDAKEPVTETESQNRVVDTTPSVGPKNTTKTELNDAAKIKILRQAGLANWYKLASKYARESQKFATMSFVEKLDFAIESFKKYNPNNNISMAQFKLLGDEVKGSLQENKENPHLEWLEKHDILKKVENQADGDVTDVYQFDDQHYDNPFIINMVIAAAVNLYNNSSYTNVDLSKKQGDFDSLKACLKKSICDGTQIKDLAALFKDLKDNKKESIGPLIRRGEKHEYDLADWYEFACTYEELDTSFVDKLDFAIESFNEYNPQKNISMAQFKLLGKEVKGSLQENEENPHLEWLEKHDILKKVKKRRKDGYVTGDMYQFDDQHYDNPFIIDMVIAAAVNLYNNFPFTNVDLSKKQGDFDSLKACLKKSICDGTQINDLAALFEDLKGNKKESIGYLILRGQEQTTQKRQVNVARKKRAKRSPDKQQTLSIAATKLGEEQDQVTRFQVGRAAAKKCLDVASSSSRRRW